MASANPSLPLPDGPIASLWTRQASSLKQGIKTGLAGTITYAIYTGWHLPQGYWAVFAALVVTQANVGAAWKAALYRTIGSTYGAVAAALLIPILGEGPVGASIVLFLLASLFGYLTALHPTFEIRTRHHLLWASMVRSLLLMQISLKSVPSVQPLPLPWIVCCPSGRSSSILKRLREI